MLTCQSDEYYIYLDKSAYQDDIMSITEKLFTVTCCQVFIQHVAAITVTRERPVCVFTNLFTSCITG